MPGYKKNGELHSCVCSVNLIMFDQVQTCLGIQVAIGHLVVTLRTLKSFGRNQTGWTIIAKFGIELRNVFSTEFIYLPSLFSR